METTMAASGEDTMGVVERWRVVAFTVKQYQACQGAPVQPGGCCEKCGQGIMYVVTVENQFGRRMDVGRDCATTMEGGPELAAIRAAEREYEMQKWRAEREAREAVERVERAERAKILVKTFAAELAQIDAIAAAPRVREWDQKWASGIAAAIREGRRTMGVDHADRELIAQLMPLVALPAARHLDAAAGSRVDADVVLVSKHSFETAFGMKTIAVFSTDSGETLAWFTTAAIGFDNPKDGYFVRLEIGGRAHIRASVKSHGSYKGEPRTEVQRCKLSPIK